MRKLGLLQSFALRRKLKETLLFLCLLFVSFSTFSQSHIDSLFSKIDPQKFAASVASSSQKLEDKLVKKSLSMLEKMQRQEEKLYNKLLSTKDSAGARLQLDGLKEKYASLKNSIKKPVVPSSIKQYIPKLDSLSTSLKFLDQNGIGGKVKDALAKTSSLQEKFQQAEKIKQFIRERKELLKAKLENFGMVKQLKQINKQVYYYTAQVWEYKEILRDAKKIQKKALEILAKTKFFKDFMQKNSLLASLFRIQDSDQPLDMSAFAGLQTRTQVSNLVQQQIAAGGTGARQQFQANIQAAQSQLNSLKAKVIKGGGGSMDADMPEGFKPNDQKSKSFLKRLEYGTNFQSQKSTNFFPTTSDIGLSLGYKLNSKSVIGLGASYKVGLGRGWNDLKITHQGLGLRSYADLKLKGSWWISGGYELNYRSPFNDFIELRNRAAWQKSGLLGISKSIPVKTKFFKKTKVVLLWDFLSYEQVPKTQPIVFRIGYQIK